MALVVVATTTASAAKALATPAAARRIGLRFSLVDLQRAATQFLAIQCCDCLVGFGWIFHFNKGEAPRAAGFAVRNYADFLDCAVRLKYTAQFRFGCAVGQVANIQVLHWSSLSAAVTAAKVG